jgi:hypothetical protein
VAAFDGPAAHHAAPRKAVSRAPVHRVSSAPRGPAPAEVEPWRPSPKDLERVARGFDVVRRHEPGVLEPSAVIDPDRPPAVRENAVAVQPDVRSKEPMRARLAGGLRALAARHGAPDRDPLLPPGGEWCRACAVERRRDGAGHFAAAVVMVEIPAEGLQLQLCGAHGAEVERQAGRWGLAIHVRDAGGSRPRRPPGDVWCLSCGAAPDLAHPDVCPCGRVMWVSRKPSGGSSRVRPRLRPVRVPAAAVPAANPTLELSGRY